MGNYRYACFILSYTNKYIMRHGGIWYGTWIWYLVSKPNSSQVLNICILPFSPVMLICPILCPVFLTPTLAVSISSSVQRVPSKNSKFVLLSFSILLFVISFTLINNTIRLSIYAKRVLIHTMRLVGATDQFIRKPFLYKSLYQGFYASGQSVRKSFFSFSDIILCFHVVQRKTFLVIFLIYLSYCLWWCLHL